MEKNLFEIYVFHIFLSLYFTRTMCFLKNSSDANRRKRKRGKPVSEKFQKPQLRLHVPTRSVLWRLNSPGASSLHGKS